MPKFDGRYKDEHGNWQDHVGAVSISHRPGGYTKFSAGWFGTGDIKWSGDRASGTIRVGGRDLRFEAEVIGNGKYEFKTYDGCEQVSYGTVDEDEDA